MTKPQVVWMPGVLGVMAGMMARGQSYEMPAVTMMADFDYRGEGVLGGIDEAVISFQIQDQERRQLKGDRELTFLLPDGARLDPPPAMGWVPPAESEPSSASPSRGGNAQTPATSGFELLAESAETQLRLDFDESE